MEEELPDETPEEEPEEPEEPEVTPAPKKRGRPAGSKNKAPDVYTALLERMGQLEETFKSRPESSTGGTPETPKKVARPRQPRQRPQPQAPAPPPASAAELLMESLHQAREERRQRQMDFYATFLPN